MGTIVFLWAHLVRSRLISSTMSVRFTQATLLSGRIEISSQYSNCEQTPPPSGHVGGFKGIYWRGQVKQAKTTSLVVTRV